MTNSDFDEDFGLEGDEFEQADAGDMEMDGDMPAGMDAPAPAAKKSGGGFGKLLLILILLGGGGTVGAAKMGLVKLPFAIPGITPAAAPVKTALKKAPPQPKPATQTAAGKNNNAPVKNDPLSMGSGDTRLSVSPEIALPAPVVSEAKPEMQLPTPELKQAPIAPPEQMVPVYGSSGHQASSGPTVQNPMLGGEQKDPLSISPPDASPEKKKAAGAQLLMPEAIGAKAGATGKIESPIPPPQEIKSPPEEASPVAAPQTADMRAIDNRIQALETKVGALESKLNDMAASAVRKSDLAALQSSIDQLRREMSSGSASRHAAPAVTHHKATQAATHHAAPAHAAVSTHWVLKSAKPGTAWVSAKGSDDMRTVSVGSSLPGIGKVTDVSQDAGGRWVVTGTHGKVRQ
ncbi:MAG: hypothetical protein GC185_07520 [Alphaproteobacteria bacterium]|nr:hypothetical protein [Alphaproteobacteria bacterium]